METIKRMFEHASWANQRILEAIDSKSIDTRDVIRLLSHLLWAEQVWLTRLKGADSSHFKIWPDATLNDCKDLVHNKNQDYSNYLQQLQVNDLEKVITYKNSTGNEFQNTIREILTHVAIHGQYHRGQINQLLRQNGAMPINVDFIMMNR